jgi:hypothetical protein
MEVLADLEKEDLLYPLRNDEIRQKLFESLRKICMEKNVGCNPILLDNAIKRLLSRARRFIPGLELLAKSWIAEVLNMRCFNAFQIQNIRIIARRS